MREGGEKSEWIQIIISKEFHEGSLFYLLLEDLGRTLFLAADGGGPVGEALQLRPHQVASLYRVVWPAAPVARG
jgi:hypothetical protein